MALTRITGDNVQANTTIEVESIKVSTFFFNDIIITNDAEVPANTNAMSAGPLTIANGVTVTVSDGSRWVII